MADVVRPVPRLLQRAQQHRLQQRVIGAVLDPQQQLRVVGRRRLVAARERERAARQEIAQRRELLGRGPLVHAVERRMLVRGEEFRGADVRGEHALLDQLVRVVAHDRHDPDDLALDVELELHLDAVEVDRAARFAGALQRMEQRVEVGQPGQQLLRLPRDALRIRQPAPHLGVGEPRARVHHRRVEPVLPDRPFGADLHVADHAQPVHRGLSEQSSLDSASGSIGITRRGKYTDVPRSRASRSSGSPSAT